MRAIDQHNNVFSYLQVLPTQCWNAIKVQKGRCLIGALAITATVVACVFTNTLAPLLVVGAVVVLTPLTLRGCRWLRDAALLFAAKYTSPNFLQFFIRLGADLEARDNNGRTALMQAVINGNLNTLNALIQAGANLEMRDNNNLTALMHAASNGNLYTLIPLLQAGSNVNAQNHDGVTVLMLAASSGNLEIVNTLIMRGAYINQRTIGGMTALLLAELSGRGAIVQRLRNIGALPHHLAANNPPLNIEAAHVPQHRLQNNPPLNVEAAYVPDHRLQNNQLYLTINRQNMTPAAAQSHLSALAENLRSYQNALYFEDLAELSLSVRYEGEHGIDSGGLSREFTTQLLKNLFNFPGDFQFFKQTESGQYELFDGMLRMAPQDLQICKNIGTFLAAVMSGFPRATKIGSVFSDKFYNFLLSLHDYGREHPEALRDGFNAMSPEEKQQLALHLAKHDLENPSYKDIIRCLQKPCNAEKTDQELDAFLKFLIDDFFVEGPDRQTPPELVEILEAFGQVENYSLLLSTPEPFTVAGNEGKRFTRDSIRGLLRTILFDECQKRYFHNKFANTLVDTYQNTCIPLVAVAEGFQKVDRRHIRPIIHQLSLDPQRATKALSSSIQGPPFTREAFVALLRRSLADNQDVQEKVNWLIEWCERGVNGNEETRATEEEMKSMLSCITASEVVTGSLRLTFAEPVEGYSQFHTCFNTVNLGTHLMDQMSKTIFIQMWKENVSRAHGEGFLE